ncbi:MAG: carboxypeptidase-like regulatory domain-containing protein, partial [Rikenellaceae bacterium]|nr:carboxypeptidase-like regulatory domain-containing protein [Rikenellaceae bacterium]
MKCFYLIAVFVLMVGRVSGFDEVYVAGSGRVTGSVKGSDGGGIEYATVVFTDKAGDYIAGATTGSDGLFSVEIA